MASKENQVNSNCSHSNCDKLNCSTCSKKHSNNDSHSTLFDTNNITHISHIYGVVSGKGGVGKSLVCGLLACKLKQLGLKVGILDADITGPSIPKIFGIKEKLKCDEYNIYPALSKNKIKIVSSNLILDDQNAPVAWRGPVINGAIGQFYSQTNWGNIDVLLIDLPPGTSDVFLTVMQSLKVDGIVSISTPQSLVDMIVQKAIKLASMLNIPVISAVENMSYFECSKCGAIHNIFGESKIVDLCDQYKIDTHDKLPIDHNFTKLCDRGEIYNIDVDKILINTTNKILKMISN